MLLFNFTVVDSVDPTTAGLPFKNSRVRGELDRHCVRVERRSQQRVIVLGEFALLDPGVIEHAISEMTGSRLLQLFRFLDLVTSFARAVSTGMSNDGSCAASAISTTIVAISSLFYGWWNEEAPES